MAVLSRTRPVTVPVCQIHNHNDLNAVGRLVTDILARQADLQPDIDTNRLAELKASLQAIHSQRSHQTVEADDAPL